MKMNKEEKFPKKLLVEGNDDLHVIRTLCKKHDISENFDVVDCKGIENLFEVIPVRFKGAGIETIGIIIDADDNMSSRWDRVKSTLSRVGFSIPKEFPRTGLILHHNNGQKAGVWIMPDNRTAGMLEDFISFLVPENDQLLPVVDAVLDDIEAQQLHRYSSGHKSKARIHSWLAWQEDPGTPLGLSITKEYLTTDHTTCQNLTNW